MTYTEFEAALWEVISRSGRAQPEGVADDAFFLGRGVLTNVADQWTIDAVRSLEGEGLLTIFHFGTGPQGKLVAKLTSEGRKAADRIS